MAGKSKRKSERELKPKLRFPQFLDDWEVTQLDRVISEFRQNSTIQDEYEILTSARRGLMRQVDYYGEGRITDRKNTGFNVILPDQITYRSRSDDGRFYFNHNELGVTGIISTYYPVFYSAAGSNAFLAALLNRFSFEIGKHSVGTSQRVLPMSALLRFELPIPTPREQRKIAGCLSSLDELIAAESQKLEALDAHKKGLMKQLFPREGGTLPRLRFPEFKHAAEWESALLGQQIEVASGQVDPTKPPHCDLPHVGGENIESETGSLQNLKSAREDAVISGKYAFDESYLLYSKIRPALNKVAAPNFKGICSADIYPIRPSTDELLRQYLVYLLRSQAFVEYATKHSARGKIPKINREALFAYCVMLPSPPEQQRIAACLSSLDELVAVQSQKLDALKTHKKGLMQQLFPSHEEAHA